MNLRAVFILLSVLFFSSLCAQKITNVDFKVASNELKIFYDIEDAQKNTLYDIKVLIELEKRSGSGIKKSIKPIAISGDIHKVKPGKNKIIKWDVLRDIEKLEGEISVTVSISKSHILNPDKKWGPEAAFVSLVLPGRGNYLVNKTELSRFYGVYTFLAYSSSLALAWSAKSASNDDYDRYQNSTSQSEMNEAYKQANLSNKIAYGLVGAAGVILATEFVYVFVRGIHNKLNKQYAFKEFPKVNLVYQGGNYGLRISKSF